MSSRFSLEGMEDQFREDILRLVSKLRDQLERLQTQPDDRALSDEVIAIGHSMRGTTSLVGFAHLSQCGSMIERMAEAGAVVFQDTVEAVNYARMKLAPAVVDVDRSLDADSFQGSLSVINVGLETFYDGLVAQGATAVQVEWRPPAGGNEKLLALLEKMRS